MPLSVSVMPGAPAAQAARLDCGRPASSRRDCVPSRINATTELGSGDCCRLRDQLWRMVALLSARARRRLVPPMSIPRT